MDSGYLAIASADSAINHMIPTAVALTIYSVYFKY